MHSVEWAIELLIDQSEDSALNVGSEACEKVLVTCCQHSMLDRAMEVYDFMRNACHTTLSPQVGNLRNPSEACMVQCTSMGYRNDQFMFVLDSTWSHNEIH